MNTKTFAQVALESSNELAAKHAELDAIAQQSDDESTKREAQRALCHALQNAKLAALNEKEQALLIEQVKLADVSEFSKVIDKSREMKIRVNAMIKSVANESPKRNKVLFNFCTAAKKRKKFTVENLQSVLAHDTKRQAQELCINLRFMNCLESCETTSQGRITSIVLDKDNAFLQSLISAYTS